MSKENSCRSGCKDVFKSFLVKDAVYEGYQEMPIIKGIDDIPNKLIEFSKITNTKDYNQWVHFYEDDIKFERIWNNPTKYLNLFALFKKNVAIL